MGKGFETVHCSYELNGCKLRPPGRHCMNPILSQDFRIPFGIIETCHVAEGIREALHQAERDLNAIVEGRRPRTYANTLGALEALQERLGRPIQIASHLMTVVSSPGLRREYRKVLPEFSTFYAELAMNEGLWRAIQDFAGTEEAAALTGVKRRHLKKTLLEFRRGGADLRDTEKARFKEIIVELKALQTQFSDNVLDATNAFGLILKSEEDLAGLPESVRVLAKRSAEERGPGRIQVHAAVPLGVPLPAVFGATGPPQEDV